MVKMSVISTHFQDKKIQESDKKIFELLKDSSSKSSEILNEFTSENSKKAFLGDMMYWKAWLSAVGLNFESKHKSIDILRCFIVQHIEGMDPTVDQKLLEKGLKAKLGTHSLATVKRRIASLSVFLDRMKWENPCREKEIKLLLEKLSKKHKRFNKLQPITKDVLEDMIKTCKSNNKMDVRDKAILFFGWSSGGRRRSEIIEAKYENLTKTSDGEYLYNLNSSKTNQTGDDDIKPIKGRAAKALTDWLEISQITSGYIFRSIRSMSKGEVSKSGLLGDDIRQMIKKRARLAGYDEKKFSSHSIRRGFVTEGGKQGKPILDIMKMTSHKNVTTAMRYYDAGNIANNSCANLLG
jgi:integrase